MAIESDDLKRASFVVFTGIALLSIPTVISGNAAAEKIDNGSQDEGQQRGHEEDDENQFRDIANGQHHPDGDDALCPVAGWRAGRHRRDFQLLLHARIVVEKWRFRSNI